MAKAVAHIRETPGQETITGTIVFSQAKEDQPTLIEGEIIGLSPGRHGMHIYVYGDLSQSLAATGGIFNPFGKNHGAPDDDERMVGDLGNIEAGEDGTTKISIEDKKVKLIGPHSVIGRSIVIRSGEDDLGRGLHETSLQFGNCGTKIAGAVIGISASK